jgi:hypothetical protein
MKKRLAVLMAFGISSFASASDLTISYNFAEVNEAVTLSGGQFEWTPSTDLAQFLVPGSLELLYPELFSVTLLPPTGNLLKYFEGKEVSVRLEDNSVVKAKVIRADQALFEIAGQYRQIDPSRVIYPSLAGVRFEPTYQWTYVGTGGKANLNYLTRALTWTPRYNLTVSGDSARLTAWADLRNQGSTDYKASEITLIAGQINLEAVNQGQPFPVQRNLAPQAASSLEAADSVQAVGESAGLQIFKYAKAVNLVGRTTTSVPFVNTNANLERVFAYNGYFNEAPKITVPMQRVYSVKTEADLPAGVVTVREDNRVVGQARIGDTPKAERATLNLGADFDLRLNRTAQALERTQKNARFKVTFSLTNTKSRAVTVRINENLGGNFTVEQAVMPGVKREAEGLSAQATLKPGEKFEGSYTVLYRY